MLALLQRAYILAVKQIAAACRLFSKPIILSNVDLPHPKGRRWSFSAAILNTKQLSTALSRYIKEKQILSSIG